MSVSEFRGKPYINIREYYDDKGVEKPGKKGTKWNVFRISLTNNLRFFDIKVLV